MQQREPEELGKGVRDAVARFVPHLKHVKTGTVISGSISNMVCIADEVVVKYGHRVTKAQLNAIQLVKESTSVPVPYVYGLHNDGKVNYLVMKLVKGDRLNKVWDRLTTEQKEKLVGQLRTYFQELHSLRGTYIGGVGRYPPNDIMFRGAKDPGPYDSEQRMNEAILRAHRSWTRYGGIPPESYVSSILPSLPCDHDIVLSHGKLDKYAIIVDMGKETVGAVVGWGSAGYLPEHWDFVNALVLQDMHTDWIRYIPIILKPFYQEYVLWHRQRQRAYGIV